MQRKHPMGVLLGHAPALLVLSCALGLSSVEMGCGSGVEGLGNEAGPLVTLQIQLEPSSFQAYIDQELEQGGSPSLRVGIIWAGVPNIDAYCIQYGPSALDPGREVGEVAKVACVDPFLVVPGLVDDSAAVHLDDPAPTLLPLDHLPTAEVLVGPPNERVAYGLLVVFDDRNRNGVLDLASSGGEFSGSTNDPSEDRLISASFSSLLKPQLRLVFREGTFNTQSFFYPMLGCDAPPEGFSYVQVSGTPLQSQCVVSSIAEPVEIRAGDPDQLASLLCKRKKSSYRMPRREAPDEELQECVNETHLVVARSEDACPRVRHFTLKGCSGNPDCAEPDWDFTEDPPLWWTCNDPGVPLLEKK